MEGTLRSSCIRNMGPVLVQTQRQPQESRQNHLGSRLPWQPRPLSLAFILKNIMHVNERIHSGAKRLWPREFRTLHDNNSKSYLLLRAIHALGFEPTCNSVLRHHCEGRVTALIVLNQQPRLQEVKTGRDPRDTHVKQLFKKSSADKENSPGKIHQGGNITQAFWLLTLPFCDTASWAGRCSALHRLSHKAESGAMEKSIFFLMVQVEQESQM